MSVEDHKQPEDVLEALEGAMAQRLSDNIVFINRNPLVGMKLTNNTKDLPALNIADINSPESNMPNKQNSPTNAPGRKLTIIGGINGKMKNPLSVNSPRRDSVTRSDNNNKQDSPLFHKKSVSATDDDFILSIPPDLDLVSRDQKSMIPENKSCSDASVNTSANFLLSTAPSPSIATNIEIMGFSTDPLEMIKTIQGESNSFNVNASIPNSSKDHDLTVVTADIGSPQSPSEVGKVSSDLSSPSEVGTAMSISSRESVDAGMDLTDIASSHRDTSNNASSSSCDEVTATMARQDDLSRNEEVKVSCPAGDNIVEYEQSMNDFYSPQSDELSPYNGDNLLTTSSNDVEIVSTVPEEIASLNCRVVHLDRNVERNIDEEIVETTNNCEGDSNTHMSSKGDDDSVQSLTEPREGNTPKESCVVRKSGNCATVSHGEDLDSSSGSASSDRRDDHATCNETEANDNSLITEHDAGAIIVDEPSAENSFSPYISDSQSPHLLLNCTDSSDANKETVLHFQEIDLNPLCHLEDSKADQFNLTSNHKSNHKFDVLIAPHETVHQLLTDMISLVEYNYSPRSSGMADDSSFDNNYESETESVDSDEDVTALSPEKLSDNFNTDAKTSTYKSLTVDVHSASMADLYDSSRDDVKHYSVADLLSASSSEPSSVKDLHPNLLMFGSPNPLSNRSKSFTFKGRGWKQRKRRISALRFPQFSPRYDMIPVKDRFMCLKMEMERKEKERMSKLRSCVTPISLSRQLSGIWREALTDHKSLEKEKVAATKIVKKVSVTPGLVKNRISDWEVRKSFTISKPE